MWVERDLETQTLPQIAIDGFMKELHLKESDRYLLKDQIEFRDAEPGITLLRENVQDVSYLHYEIFNRLKSDHIYIIFNNFEIAGCLPDVHFKRKCISFAGKH